MIETSPVPLVLLGIAGRRSPTNDGSTDDRRTGTISSAQLSSGLNLAREPEAIRLEGCFARGQRSVQSWRGARSACACDEAVAQLAADGGKRSLEFSPPTYRLGSCRLLLVRVVPIRENNKFLHSHTAISLHVSPSGRPRAHTPMAVCTHSAVHAPHAPQRLESGIMFFSRRALTSA